MNETTFYYVFSTVAQALASAYGAMAAVVLFTLANLHMTLDGKAVHPVRVLAIKRLKLGFVVTSLTIGACIVAIPFAPFLAAHERIANVVVAVAVVASLTCGRLYYSMALALI
jgi:hypothetical protein